MLRSSLAFNSSSARRLKIYFPLMWIQINDEFSYWNEKQAEMTLFSHVKDFLEIVRVWWTHEEVAWWSHKNSTLHAVFLLRKLSSNWVPRGRNAKFEIKSWHYLRWGGHATFFLFARSPTFALHTAREKRIARTPDRLPQISLRSPGSMLPTWWSKTD